MLRRLTIKNVALISLLELNFCNHLNVLSGETGAGKSIIVDSLMLLLGGRYDKTLLRYGETSGWVEGVFDCSDKINQILDYYGIDNDDQIIVSRKFNIDGRNDIRINGRAVTTTILKKIMTNLVDICGQNEHQSLGDESNHLMYLDYYARHSTQPIIQKIAEKYRDYIEIKNKLDTIGDESEREIKIEIYKKQINEIKQANIYQGEEDELTQQKNQLVNFEQIKNSLDNAYTLLTNGEENSTIFLDNALSSLQKANNLNKTFDELVSRLDSVLIEVNDIGESIYQQLDNLYFSQDELDRLEERLSLIKSLRKKYGSYDLMMEKYDDLVTKCDMLENSNKIYEKLINDKENILDELYMLCSDLSNERKITSKKLAKDLLVELSQLGMKDSKFEVVFNDFPSRENIEKYLTPNGVDEAEFYLSPNAGQPLKPLVKIISGGELSRLMLAFKVVFSNIDQTPTLIFDEIDTGISGEIGLAVSKKLAKLSRKRQLLCVTHLSQIASMGDKNFFISKSTIDDQTYTKVQLLKDNKLIGEIARLSGSKDIVNSVAAYDNAKQMKEWSDNYKKSLVGKN